MSTNVFTSLVSVSICCRRISSSVSGLGSAPSSIFDGYDWPPAFSAQSDWLTDRCLQSLFSQVSMKRTPLEGKFTNCFNKFYSILCIGIRFNRVCDQMACLLQISQSSITNKGLSSGSASCSASAYLHF